MKSISTGKRTSEPPDLFKEEMTIKTLGLHWKPYSDSFAYQFLDKNVSSNTKRNILSQIASIFDPVQEWLSKGGCGAAAPPGTFS